jgi:hypothetical protein
MFDFFARARYNKGMKFWVVVCAIAAAIGAEYLAVSVGAGGVGSLLGATPPAWGTWGQDADLGKLSFAQQLAWVMLYRIFPFLALAGIVWGIWISWSFAKAKDAQSREAAGKRLIKAIFTILAVVAIWGILWGTADKIPDPPKDKTITYAIFEQIFNPGE